LISTVRFVGCAYFFKAVDWRKVFKEIEKCIIKNYTKNAEFKKNKMIKDYVNILSKNNQIS